MNRFEEAKRDIDRAMELGDFAAVAEIIEHVAEEAKGYGFDELAGQLRVYFLNLDAPNCMTVLRVMARKAADIDIARGLAYGPGFEEGIDALHWALR